jgi:hypothetical protein
MKVLFNLQSYVDAGKAHYQHAALVIAEGLEELGIEFYGNIDWWYDHENKQYTVRKAPEGFVPDVELFSCWYVVRNRDTFVEKMNLDRINIMLDAQDGWDTPVLWKEMELFDKILHCHSCKPFYKFKHKMSWSLEEHAAYPAHTVPWNFGLSNRLINMIDKYRAEEVRDQALMNFRMPYNVRAKSVEIIPPLIEHKFKVFNNVTDPINLIADDDLSYDDLSYWAQSGRRHNEIYFKDINQSKYTFAFCGREYDHPIPHTIGARIDRNLKRLQVKIHNTFGLPPVENKYIFILQYGGWRLFESFISNTVPLQMDFEWWGMDWPEMPKDGEHYISVKGFRFEEAAKRMLEMSEDERQRIANNGREWCLKHYSPKPVAERFLNHVKDINK